MAETPEILAGRYRIVRRIGRGGMGVVYQVVDERTKRRLAMKLIGRGDSANVERFRREASALLRIDSDHVVKVLEADFLKELGGRPYIVMELLRGRDVASWLRERKRFTPREVVGILSQAVLGIAAAHDKGIVHRDIKPENLFLHDEDNGRRTVKVLDFGLARHLRAPGLTLTGETLGTPLYMAPEQVKGLGEIGIHTDVWSIGVVALEMLTGQEYFRAKSVPGILAAILYAPLRAPSERWPHLPRGIDAWFARSCARDPQQRFANVREQMAALEAALGVKVPVPVIAKKKEKGDSWIARAAMTAAACVTAVGGLVVCAAPPEPAAPITIPVASASAAPIATTPAPAPTPVVVAETPAPQADSDPCSPPYTVDARGGKHYKVECIEISSTIQAPATGTATLVVACVPACDSAILDGTTSLGGSPLRRNVAAGRHTLTVTSGSVKKTLTFTSVAGQTNALRLSMQ
jgi:tRNA A-37 threonylcarbamoyl transferase component Bud32